MTSHRTCRTNRPIIPGCLHWRRDTSTATYTGCIGNQGTGLDLTGGLPYKANPHETILHKVLTVGRVFHYADELWEPSLTPPNRLDVGLATLSRAKKPPGRLRALVCASIYRWHSHDGITENQIRGPSAQERAIGSFQEDVSRLSNLQQPRQASTGHGVRQPGQGSTAAEWRHRTVR
jgi:hypothetical protein